MVNESTRDRLHCHLMRRVRYGSGRVESSAGRNRSITVENASATGENGRKVVHMAFEIIGTSHLGGRPRSAPLTEARVREIARQEVDAALDEMAQQALAAISREK